MIQHLKNLMDRYSGRCPPELLSELMSELSDAYEELVVQNDHLQEICNSFEHEQENYRALYKSTPAYILQINDHGEILESNHFFHQSLDRNLGKNLYDYIPIELREESAARFLDFLEHPEGQSWQVVLQGKDQIKKDVLFHGSSLRHEGKDRRLIICGIDIQQEIEEKTFLQGARKEAERKDRYKTEMLALISREMRTPVNSLMMSLELIEQKGYPPGYEELLSSIESSSRFLHHFSDELLQMYLLETGDFKSEKKPFLLSDFLSQITQYFGLVSKTEHIEISNDIEPTLAGEWLFSDHSKLHQVICGLSHHLSRKIEENGSLKFQLSCSPELPGQLLFSLQGPPSDNHNHVWKENEIPFFPFYRRIVDVIGGELTTSKNTLGFELAVPFQKGKTFSVLSGKMIHQIPHLEGKPKILILEDQMVFAKMLSMALTKAGAEVHLTKNGEEALEYLEHHPCDFIIMDLLMPIMNGIETMKKLTSMGCQLPVIGITAEVKIDVFDEAIKAGMKIVLKKPISIKKIIESIQFYLG